MNVLAKEGEDAEVKSKEDGSLLTEKENGLDNIETKLWEKNKLKQDMEKRQQELSASKDELINLIESTKVKVEDLQIDLDEKKEALKESRNDIGSRQNKLEELRQELVKNQELLQKVMPSINDTYNEVAKLDYEVKMLEQLEKEAIGYSRGVKELMQAEIGRAHV